MWIEGDVYNPQLICKYGKVSDTWVGSDNPGVITGMGPITIVAAEFQKDRENLARYGVDYQVRMDAETGILTAVTTANNGKWIHVLEQAHWRDGKPHHFWADDIMIGRYPD